MQPQVRFAAKKMYRWTDEHGGIYFSDQVPPEQAQHSRAELSKTGRVLLREDEPKSDKFDGTAVLP